MFILNAILLLIALLLFIPNLVLLLECSAAWGWKPAPPLTGPRPPVAVLVPAYNEEPFIAATLSDLLAQLAPGDRLVVVADNCTDATAQIARQHGAEVVERHDPQRRGKGYALDYGMRYLQAAPPPVVLVVDADCRVSPGLVDRLAGQADAWGQPIQAVYLFEPPTEPRPQDSISMLAILVKNLVRPLGLKHLGLPCLLNGSGMAFPWSVITTAPLATDSIVEDMQLTIDLALAGHLTLFCPQAQVGGCLQQSPALLKNQRLRWEHGHLTVLLTQVPRLLRASFSQKSWPLLTLGLELAVPPLSLWLLSWWITLLVALLTAVGGGWWLPAGLLLLQGLFLGLALGLAWRKFGRAYISAAALRAIPAYLWWKLPIYLAFLAHRQKNWHQTER